MGSSIAISGADASSDTIDPCQLHAALMTSGYARSANLEADEVEPGEDESASRQRGASVMSEALSRMSVREVVEASNASKVEDIKKGGKYWYWDARKGAERQVEVLSVDYSLRPPSFVIRFDDGGERETEGHRLSLKPACLNVKVKILCDKNSAFGEKDEVLQLSLHPKITISQLKALVQDRVDVPLDKQKVLFGKQLREDTETLKQMQVADGDIIHVSVIPGSRVFIKEMDQSSNTVEVTLTETVLVLKQRVGELKGWSPANIVFVFAGKRLEPDTASLESLQVQKESTIFLLFRDASEAHGKTRRLLNEAVLAPEWDYDFREVDDKRAKW